MNSVIARLTCFVLIAFYPSLVYSHGRLMDPPARNAMWRFGYPTPVDYNDNELFCGGFAVQWNQNGGKCGVCGNNFKDPAPRNHEMGGLFYAGLTGRRYTPGQVIEVFVDLTANHWGYFEVKLCPANHNSKREAQDCFDKYPLRIPGTNETRYRIPTDTPKTATFRYRLKLPDGLSCSHCILQWTYFTGNTWGICPNGTGEVGCGHQETFVNCADISISSASGGRPGLGGEDNPYLLYVTKEGEYASPPLTPGQDLQPLIVRSQVCLGAGEFKGIPQADTWCMQNCLKYPPNCPESRCSCISSCEPIGELKGVNGTDVFCHINCLRYPQDLCPTDKCLCK